MASLGGISGLRRTPPALAPTEAHSLVPQSGLQSRSCPLLAPDPGPTLTPLGTAGSLL